MVAGGDATERRARAWFDELGYEIVLADEAGTVGVELRQRSNPDVRRPKYGSGRTGIEAVASAAARWRVEQIGTDNARRPVAVRGVDVVASELCPANNSCTGSVLIWCW